MEGQPPPAPAPAPAPAKEPEVQNHEVTRLTRSQRKRLQEQGVESKLSPGYEAPLRPSVPRKRKAKEVHSAGTGGDDEPPKKRKSSASGKDRKKPLAQSQITFIETEPRPASPHPPTRQAESPKLSFSAIISWEVVPQPPTLFIKSTSSGVTSEAKPGDSRSASSSETEDSDHEFDYLFEEPPINPEHKIEVPAPVEEQEQVQVKKGVHEPHPDGNGNRLPEQQRSASGPDRSAVTTTQTPTSTNSPSAPQESERAKKPSLDPIIPAYHTSTTATQTKPAVIQGSNPTPSSTTQPPGSAISLKAPSSAQTSTPTFTEILFAEIKETRTPYRRSGLQPSPQSPSRPTGIRLATLSSSIQPVFSTPEFYKDKVFAPLSPLSWEPVGAAILPDSTTKPVVKKRTDAPAVEQNQLIKGSPASNSSHSQ